MQDGLLERLRTIVGPSNVLTGVELSPYVVEGRTPDAAVFPGSIEEVSSAIALAAEAGLSVTPWGGGTAASVGMPSARAGLVLGLRRLDRVLEHAPGDLTVTVEAGTTVAALQAALQLMIAHLSGTLLSKQATSAIVDVSGVGYEVAIPLSTFYELGEAGEPVQLRIYTHVREDAIQLYGFKTIRERELFLQLISVNGVGPGLAIKLLSGMNADEMIASIRTNNLVRLVAIPGVGRKTAERLVVDLRDKIAALSSPALEEEFAAKSAATGTATSEDSMRNDAISALANLGYQKGAAEKAVKSAIDEGGELSVEGILRRSLRSLAKA